MEDALAAINEEKVSLRQAALTYGIPKSTLSLYKSGISENGKKKNNPGRAPFISPEEEKLLVDYVIHRSRIGYRKTKESLAIFAVLCYHQACVNIASSPGCGERDKALFPSPRPGLEASVNTTSEVNLEDIDWFVRNVV